MNYQKALKILGLTDNFTEEELKKNYYRLAREYHPDINSDRIDAEERAEILKEINVAKEYLENYLKSGSKKVQTDNVPPQEQKEEQEELIREFARIVNAETLKYESKPLYSYLEKEIKICKIKTVQALSKNENVLSQKMIIESMHAEINEMFQKCSIILKRFELLGKKAKKLNDASITNKLEKAYNQFGTCLMELTELELDSLEESIKLSENKSMVSISDARRKLSDIKGQISSITFGKKSQLRNLREQISRKSK